MRNNPLRYVDPNGHYLISRIIPEVSRTDPPETSQSGTAADQALDHYWLRTHGSHWNAGNPAQVIKRHQNAAILSRWGQRRCEAA